VVTVAARCLCPTDYQAASFELPSRLGKVMPAFTFVLIFMACLPSSCMVLPVAASVDVLLHYRASCQQWALAASACGLLSLHETRAKPMPAGLVFCSEPLRQYVMGKEGRGTACPPLRRKLTGKRPPWGAGRVSARW